MREDTHKHLRKNTKEGQLCHKMNHLDGNNAWWWWSWPWHKWTLCFKCHYPYLLLKQIWRNFWRMKRSDPEYDLFLNVYFHCHTLFFKSTNQNKRLQILGWSFSVILPRRWKLLSWQHWQTRPSQLTNVLPSPVV
jgi:hypothetical protein